MDQQNRRDFLKKAAAGGAVLAWSVPTFSSVAHAAQVGSTNLQTGTCYRVKWNTSHAAKHANCHGDASKDEINNAVGFQLADPPTGNSEVQFSGGQCCNDGPTWYSNPVNDAPIATLNDIITVTGNSSGTPDGAQSMTFTVDQTKAPGCYLTDPAVAEASYSKIIADDCEIGGGKMDGVKAHSWMITWTGDSVNTGGKIPIYIKFYLHCGASNNCAESPTSRTFNAG